MKVSSPSISPNGILEIFKNHKVYDIFIKDCAKNGDVKCEFVNI